MTLAIASALSLVDLKKVGKSQIYAAITVASAYLLVSLPFRKYDEGGLSFLFSAALLSTFMLPHEKVKKVVDLLALLTAISSISACLVVIANIIGIDLPWYRLSQDFRTNPNDFYRLYPGSVVLSTQIWDIGHGTFVRTSGLLREPGHFAMLCAGLLIANDFSIKKTRYKWTLMGGVLTISPAFIVILGVGLLFKRSNKYPASLRWMVVFLMIAGGAVAFAFFAPKALHERIVTDNLEHFEQAGVEGVLDARSRGQFYNFYNRISFQDKILGLGSGVLDAYGFYDAQGSDYRSFLARKGLISVIILLFSMLALMRIGYGNRFNYGMAFMFFCVVLAHRSWMLIQPWFVFLLSYMILSPKEQRKRESSGYYDA